MAVDLPTSTLLHPFVHSRTRRWTCPSRIRSRRLISTFIHNAGGFIWCGPLQAGGALGARIISGKVRGCGLPEDDLPSSTTDIRVLNSTVDHQKLSTYVSSTRLRWRTSRIDTKTRTTKCDVLPLAWRPIRDRHHKGVGSPHSAEYVHTGTSTCHLTARTAYYAHQLPPPTACLKRTSNESLLALSSFPLAHMNPC